MQDRFPVDEYRIEAMEFRRKDTAEKINHTTKGIYQK